MSQTLVVGLSVGGIYGLLALGIVVVYKTTRVLNFALGELGTLAAFIVWTLTKQMSMSWFIAAPIAIALVTLLGVAFERLVIWPNVDASRLTLTTATLGLGLFVYGLEFAVWGSQTRLLTAPLAGCGWRLAGVCVPPVRLLGLGVNILIALGLVTILRSTTFGLGVLAASEDPVTVRLMGVRLSRISMFAWGLSAALAAFSGLILIPSVQVFLPGTFTEYFLKGMTAALVGGFTSLPGAFVGGVAIGVFEEALRNTFPAQANLVQAGLFLVVLSFILLRPQGLLGRRA